MATTYHVATDGSGDYTTIAQVNAATFSAGDEVLFRRGDTWAERLNIISKNGTAVSHITFGDYGAGNKPEMNGIRFTTCTYIDIKNIDTYASNTYAAGYILGCNNILVDGCEVDGRSNGTQRAGLTVGTEGSTPSYNITINNCTVHDCGDSSVSAAGGGIKLNAQTHNSTIENCTVYNNIETNIQTFSNDDMNWNYSITIKNNIVYNSLPFNDNQETGINIGFRNRDCVVEQNYVYDCRVALQVDSLTENSIVRNNIAINGKDNLIRCIANATGDCSEAKIYNNTCIMDDSSLFGIRFLWTASSGTGYCKNNIVYNNSLSDVQMLRVDSANFTITSDYNDFYSVNGYKVYYNGTQYTDFATYKAASGQDTNSIISDPLLTSAYKLTKDSPCVDAGETLSEVTDDYEGNPRPMGGGTDIGAYEYYSKKLRNCKIG